MFAGDAWYLRHSPFAKGRWGFVHAFLPRLRAIGHTMGERLITTRHGFVMKANLGDLIGQHICMTGNFEPPTAERIGSLLRDGDTIIHVGAHIGFFTLLASRKVGPRRRVHPFEPVPSTSAVLKANLARIRSANVVAHECALSNSDGTVTVYEGPKHNKGNSSMRHLADSSTERSVAVASFDSPDASGGPVHLIKINVESAEQLVIEGMAKCLRKNRPHLIIEVSDEFLGHFGHSAKSLHGVLEGLSYVAYEITNNGLAPLSADTSTWPRQFNAYFSTDRVDSAPASVGSQQRREGDLTPGA